MPFSGGTPQASPVGTGDFSSSKHCQLFGLLQKKASANQSNRWSRRFFVLKDGYLLYYPESEKKDFETKAVINIHPKGVVPLGGSTSTCCNESGHPFAIRIENSCIEGSIVLAADSEYLRDKWLSSVELAARITHQNAQLGDVMIERLESEGLRMAVERQKYYDKLQSETIALQSEKERNEVLMRMTEELEEQKQELRALADGLRTDLDCMKSELDDTSAALMAVEEEKSNLKLISETLEANLMELESERCAAEVALASESGTETSTEAQELRAKLEDIERQTRLIEDENNFAQHRLEEAEELASQLQQEKTEILSHAEQLRVSIQDLSEQKSRAEQELAEEVQLRQEAERQLRAAQQALSSLRGAVDDAAPDMDETLNEQMQADVKQLTDFFERVARESLYDAQKPMLMKNSLSSVKSGTLLHRARTIRLEGHKRRRQPASGVPQSGARNYSTLPVRFKKPK